MLCSCSIRRSMKYSEYSSKLSHRGSGRGSDVNCGFAYVFSALEMYFNLEMCISKRGGGPRWEGDWTLHYKWALSSIATCFRPSSKHVYGVVFFLFSPFPPVNQFLFYCLCICAVSGWKESISVWDRVCCSLLWEWGQRVDSLLGTSSQSQQIPLA